MAPPEGEHTEPGQKVQVAVPFVVDEVAALALDLEAVELDLSQHPGQLRVDVLRVEGEILARALVQHLLQIKGHAMGSRSNSGRWRQITAGHRAPMTIEEAASPPAVPVHAKIHPLSRRAAILRPKGAMQ
jgi:hypothetical protein